MLKPDDIDVIIQVFADILVEKPRKIVLVIAESFADCVERYGRSVVDVDIIENADQHIHAFVLFERQ